MRKRSPRAEHLKIIEDALSEVEAVLDEGYGELLETLQKAQESVLWLNAYPDTLIEELASLEHDQFWYWTKEIMHEVSEERREQWEPLQVPYAMLSMTYKPVDRAWAQAVIQTFKTGWADLRRRG